MPKYLPEELKFKDLIGVLWIVWNMISALFSCKLWMGLIYLTTPSAVPKIKLFWNMG